MRHLIHIFLLIAGTTLASCQANSNTDYTYRNPVIPGAFPDPSVIRVGEKYYAAGTSFNFAPCYPVYTSDDLVNWVQSGAVFPEPPEWTSVDFWAPELFYHDSTFFVYYTAKRKSDGVACIGVASTRDIRDGFTDHGLLIEWGEEAIDAYVFKDGDGQLYITWKAYGLTEGRPIEILASALSDDGLRLVGEHFTLTDHSRGWRGGNDEGQCLVKHGDYYYLLYSDGGCCDHFCDYRVMVSRSRDLRSGWEQLPQPILEGGSPWVCPGHGTLVTMSDNHYFYLHHAYHEEDFEYIGRQGLLGEIAWNDETEWPYFIHGTSPVVTTASPNGNSIQVRDSVKDDYYSDPDQLKLREWDLHFPRPVPTYQNDVLELKGSHPENNFLGFRPETGHYTFQAEVLLIDSKSGMGIYTNNRKMLLLSADKNEVSVSTIQDGDEVILSKIPVKELTRLFLKLDVKTGKFTRFSWSEDGTEWHSLPVGEKYRYDASFLATWGYSPRTGLIWSGTGPAKYRDIKVLYNFRNM